MGNLLVYKASAGSGKTYNLALEYIKLAVQNPSPTSYRRILAVTFTNKATGEMKERILLQLYNLAHGGLDSGFLENLMKHFTDSNGVKLISEKEIFKRAGKTLQAILHDYDHFRVETIDSFFQSLLTNLAHELKLPRTFRVDLNDKDVVMRAVHRLLSELNDSSSKQRKAGAAGYVMDYMDESINDEKGWNMVNTLCDFAQRNMRNETYIHHEDKLTNALDNKEGIENLRKWTAEAEQEYGTRLTHAAQRAIDLMESMPDGPKQFSWGNNIVNYPKKIVAGDYLVPAGSRINTAIEDFNKLVSSKNKKDTALANAAMTLSGLLGEVRKAQAEYGKHVTTGRITLSKLRPMRLLRLIEENIRDINEEANRFMLSKTPELFSRIVKKEDASFVFERVGTTFDHIMIDEFQDTSRMQWDNFHKLLVENMATGNQCMLVGDIKQSIYRWRGGDWAILNEIDKDPAFPSKNEIPLKINFRSKRNIVEFNNAFFPFAAKQLDALAMDNPAVSNEWQGRITAIYEDVAQKVKDNAEGGWVRVALAEAGNTLKNIYEDLYSQIVLLHNHAHVAYRDMGILVRQNSEGAGLIEYFASEHPDIPINSDVAYQLSASPAVTKLVYALRYIACPDNLEARLHLLTALGISGRADDNTGKDVFAADYPEVFADPSSLLGELGQEETLEQLQRMPLYELCQQLIMMLHLTAPTKEEEADNGQSAYIFYFLDAVLDFLADNPSDLALFLDYWDTTLSTKSTTGDTGDCIYVMTVHKSKGLACHTIFVPFCEWDVTKLRSSDFLWSETPNEKPFNALPVTTFSPNEKGIELSMYSPVVESELVQQRIDNLNTLYVAFTRAKENLLVWCRTKKDKSKPVAKVGDLLDRYANNEKKVICKVKEQPVWERLSEEEMENTTFNFDPDDETAQEDLAASIAFDIYTSGELAEDIPCEEKKKEKAASSEAKKNPLDHPTITPIAISLNPQPRAQIEFRQSNPAKDFMAEAESTALAQLGETPDDAEALKEQETQRAYIDRGKLLHRIFSQIRTADDLPRAFESLKAEGVLSSAKEAESIIKLITKRIGQKDVAHWFDGTWQLFNECDILYREKGRLCTGRPDRVMVKDGHTVVVDFKFGKPRPDEYKEQVKRYINYLKQMGHTHVDGYLWYMFDGTVEQV